MSNSIYYGVDGKARKSEKIYYGVPTEIPIYEGGGTQVPLTLANIDKFFTVSKSSWDLAGNFTDYFSIDKDACDTPTDYNSAWGTYDGSYGGSIFSVTALQDISSLSLSLSGSFSKEGIGGIVVNDVNVCQVDSTQSEASADITNVSVGATISVVTSIDAGEYVSFSITINDVPAPGTPGDWTVSDESTGKLKLVPGIFGEPLTCCSVELTAKTNISNVVLSGRYYTESGHDLLTVKLNNTYILNEASGDSSLSNRWSGNLASGDKIYLYYSKDQSNDNSSETDTAFFISCNPLIEGTITGYETKPIARKVKKIYFGVDGIARLCYSKI